MPRQEWELVVEKELANKWIHFWDTVHFKDETPLSIKITLFIDAANVYVAECLGLDKSELKTRTLTTLLTANAIVTSGTHSREAIARAYREMAADFKRQNNLTWWRVTLLRLNSPMKRSFALVFAIGIPTFLIGFGSILNDSWTFERGVERWLNVVFRQNRYETQRYWLAAWGTYAIIVGSLLSFFYDATIGRLVAWIKSGGR